MASQYETCIALLETKVDVSVVAGVETTLYTANGNRAVITHIGVRDPDASLSGCSVVVFGTNSGTRNDWEDTGRTLALVTGVTKHLLIRNLFGSDTADQVTTIVADGGTFGVKITTNSGTATKATFDVFGYLIDV